MIEKVKNLRAQGLSYQKIATITGLTRFKVEYICNPLRREILTKANAKYRHKNPIQKKVASFHCITPKHQRVYPNFTFKEFLTKVGSSPKCYISNQDINLLNPASYSIDHVIPVAQGGTNHIDNAKLVSTEFNQLKMNRTPQQLEQDCVTVLLALGYKVSKS